METVMRLALVTAGDGTAMLRTAVFRVALAAMFLITPVGLRTAAACSCGAAANPPCAAVWRADAVFVGTVVDRTPERVGGSLSWAVHKVAVHQTLRGSVDSFITLVPGFRPTAEQIAASQSRPEESMMISTCDYDFKMGRQYVIYARRTADGRWTTSMCTGTKPIEDAAADLDYIASIPLAQPTGRVYGSIERTLVDATDRTTPRSVPATGVSVALTSGSNRVTVATDSEGKLDVQVPPGEYTIAPVVPQTIRVYGAPIRVSVPGRGCAPVHFSLVTNGRIEGRVIREDGTGVPRVSVDLVPADSSDERRLESFTTAPSGTTDESGRFRVDAILPGRYLVAVNARFGPRLVSPYATTYFPGVARKDARAIEIDEGERKTGFTIVVTPLAETTVSGMVVLADDRPVADASVTAVPVDHVGTITASAKTDSSGAFQLRVLTGVSYVIRVSAPTTNGFRQTETVVFVDQEKEGVRLSIGR
jgi:carboxypeptidase family protein